ncbi:MAG: cytochrome C oxidase subunit II [Spirochaetota bacterium]|nr:cytochrome C oxidase subunit II [Spirochaetota bacterium]
MAIFTPKNWWKPLHRGEKIWVYVIIGWGIIMTVMMPLGHFWGQNVSQTTYKYKFNPEKGINEFETIFNNFINKYAEKELVDGKVVIVEGKPKLKTEGPSMIPIVDASIVPKSSDGYVHLFLAAQTYRFSPIFKLERGKEYKIHISSFDVQHGFSLQPLNINYQALPGYDFVITMKPRSDEKLKVFNIVCNEFCGSSGHHTMIGKMYVK